VIPKLGRLVGLLLQAVAFSPSPLCRVNAALPGNGLLCLSSMSLTLFSNFDLCPSQTLYLFRCQRYKTFSFVSDGGVGGGIIS
jgi:hypothetical protein